MLALQADSNTHTSFPPDTDCSRSLDVVSTQAGCGNNTYLEGG